MLPPERLRVLLLEDDDVDARIICLHAAAMADLPVEVVRVVSVDEARLCLARDVFDVCVIDFWLGCETSLDLLYEFEARIAKTPTLVLTSLSTPDIRSLTRDAGAFGFLGKEKLSPATLRTALLAAMDQTEPVLPLATVDPVADRLEKRLLAALRDEACGSRSQLASPSRGGEEPALSDDLSGLMKLNETMRLGLFERVFSRRRYVGLDRGASSMRRLAVAAAEIASDILERRGQTLSVSAAPAAGSSAQDPAALFFLIFELIARTSQQSANGTRVQADIKIVADWMSLNLLCLVPASANADSVVLPPLASQVLLEMEGSLTNLPGPDGSLMVSARFRVSAPS